MEKEAKFHAFGNRVFIGKTPILTAWIDNPAQKRQAGESWLDMRKRMKPLFDEAMREAERRAKICASALNDQGDSKDWKQYAQKLEQEVHLLREIVDK